MGNIEKQRQNKEKNNNLKISKEQLKELEKELEIKKNFKELENQIITQNYGILFPQYKEELKKYESDPETLKGYLFLLDMGKNLLGKHTFEILTKSLPLKEILPFIYEMIKIEKEKDLLETATIILTNEEIKELKQLLATNATKKKLTEFIEKQLFENVTTAELIKGTSLENKLKEVNENPYTTVNNIDFFWYKFLQAQNLDLSDDTLRNMATGITITLAFIYTNSPSLLDTNLEALKDPKVLIEFLIKNKDKVKSLKEKLNTLFEAIKELKLGDKSEKYEILMDPQKFHLLIMKVLAGASQQEIKQEILKSKKDKNIIPDHEKIQKETKYIFDNLGEKISPANAKVMGEFSKALEGIKKAKNYIEGVKNQMKDYLLQSADYLFTLKKGLENVGGLNLWKYIKDFVNWILKFLGFKNGWGDFEKEVEKREFKDILDYLKKYTSVEEIKKEKNTKNPSIFFEGFKNKLDKISQIQPKGHLSYETLKFLKQQDLQNFFEWKNFKKIIKQAGISEKDFFKEVFSTEEKTQKSKKCIIGYIDFDKLDNIIKKSEILPTQENKSTPESLIATSYFTENEDYKIDNPEINKIITYYEKKFKQNVKMLFGFDNFSYKKYIKAIAQLESSGGNYKAINPSSGALGKYQFMPSTLWDYKKEICGSKICNQEQLNQNFLNSPALQEQIMGQYTMSHLIEIHNLIKNGNLAQPATLEDLIKMLGKAHFTGVGNLKNNYSDGKMRANKYAENTAKTYKSA